MTGNFFRRFTLSLLFVGVLLGTSLLGGTAAAQTYGPGSYNPEKFTDEQYALYEKQLNALLLTRRDEEKLFIHLVVEKVKAGKIPTQLVQTSYGWVRNKRPNTKYPFVFFEQVLRLQAKKADLADDVVHAYDYAIYRKLITPRR